MENNNIPDQSKNINKNSNISQQNSEIKKPQYTYNEILQNIEKAKQKYQTMNKDVANIFQGMGLDALTNTEQYGKASIIQDISQITEHLKDQKHFVFLTGAGISVASGIQTYRGKGSNQGYEKNGVFYKNEEIATYDFMMNNSQIFWERQHEFLINAQQAKPNISHLKIAQLQKNILQDNKKDNRQFTLITQNIDNLHVQAFYEQNIQKQLEQQQKSDSEIQMNPCDSIYQIHGNMKYGRCLKNCTREDKLFKINTEQILKNNFSGICCNFCGEKGRPNILYFDENYNEENYFVKSLYKRVILETENEEEFRNIKTCLIVIGTTLETAMANQIVRKFIKNKQMVVEINRDQQIIEAGENTYCLMGEAEKIVPQLCDEIIKNLN